MGMIWGMTALNGSSRVRTGADGLEWELLMGEIGG